MRATIQRMTGQRLARCAVLLAAGLFAFTVQATTLRTSAQADTEPKFIADGKGRITGLCIDILRAIEKTDPGLRFSGDQQWMPLVRAYSELATGQQDVQCAVQRNEERERLYHFFEIALFEVNYHFLARIDDRVVINNWDDVRRLKPNGLVLINRGFAADYLLKQVGGIEVDASSTSPQLNLQKLVAGRGRLFFHRGPGLQQLLERTGSVGKVRILPQVMYSGKLYLASSKQLAPDIILRLQQALERLDKSGELQRLLHRWE